MRPVTSRAAIFLLFFSAFNVNGLLSRRSDRSSEPITNVPGESGSSFLSLFRRHDKHKRRRRIFKRVRRKKGRRLAFAGADADFGKRARTDVCRRRVDFVVLLLYARVHNARARRSHVSKYRDPRRNLRNRRMTSFIDHVATINLIRFSAWSNMAAGRQESRGERIRARVIIHTRGKEFHYFENTHVRHCWEPIVNQLPFIGKTFIRVYNPR